MCVHAHALVYVCITVHAHMHVCGCVHVCMGVVCVYMRIGVCVCVHVHSSPSSLIVTLYALQADPSLLVAVQLYVPESEGFA